MFFACSSLTFLPDISKWNLNEVQKDLVFTESNNKLLVLVFEIDDIIFDLFHKIKIY